MNRVIEKKYLRDNEKRCGYISGVAFANQLGLTTQVAMTCEVVTNKAIKDYRETTLAKSRVIIRKPRVTINEENILVTTPVAAPVEILFEDNTQTKRILEYCSSPRGIFEVADM